MDPEYGRRYRELYERHWWWRAREWVVVETLERHEPVEGWGPVLDVGCGDGLAFPVLSRFGAVEGVEPAAGLVTREDTGHGRIHVRPFDASFAPDRSYGLVTMLDVLEHMDDPAGAVAHAGRLLRPGGGLLVTVPAFMSLWTAHDVLNEHRTRYRKGEVRRLLEGGGFAVEEARYLFVWVAKAKLLVRLAEAVRGARPRPPEIPPAPLNRLLYRATRLEERLLSRLPVPFGSSVLAVGFRTG